MRATRTHGESLAGAPLLRLLPDADGAPFLEVAAAGRVDALVTGDARHFVPLRGHHGVPVLTPRELLDLL